MASNGSFRNNRLNHALRRDNGGTAAPVTLNPEMMRSVQETESLGRAQKTRNDYNNRIMKAVKWVKEKIQSHAIDGIDESEIIRELTDEQKQDKVNFHNSTHDFIYTKLPSAITKAYLSDPAQKYKKRRDPAAPQMQYGFDHIRKHHDAILYGANRAKEQLPHGYGQDMKQYLDSLKKSKVRAKKDGELDENEADPIGMPLYHLICEWAISIGDIFLWVFTVLLWNCMSRCVNIDDLQLGNISMGTDSAIIEFDSTKMDKKGEKTTPKNIYANPFDHHVCVFTALGCYFCLNDEQWSTSSKKYIFIHKAAKAGSASSRYCHKIRDLVSVLSDKLKEFIRPDHCNPYGLRKGSATHATSGTTAPPPITSIFMRGEWSMGVVQDIYWRYCQVGDQYLGRCMACLDPNSPVFDTLPPHFVKGLEEQVICDAFNLCFKNIRKSLDERDIVNMTGLLLRCLASIVHHAESLKEVMRSNPKHPFHDIPILSDDKMLADLKALVTTEKSQRLAQPTGVPPHTQTLRKLEVVLNMVMEERADMKRFEEKFTERLKDAINETAAQSGQVTRQKMIEIMEEHSTMMRSTLRKDIEEVVRNVLGGRRVMTEGGSESARLDENGGHRSSAGYTSYAHSGKLGLDTCKGWDFPSCTLKSAWRFWLLGQPNFEQSTAQADGSIAVKKCPIRPFRMFKWLTSDLSKTYMNSWCPVLRMMEAAPEINLPSPERLDNEFVESSYKTGKIHVLNTVEYIKQMNRSDSWRVATWSQRVKRNSIMKNGTQADKDRLPPPTRWNSRHTAKRTFTKGNSATAKRARVECAMSLLS